MGKKRYFKQTPAKGTEVREDLIIDAARTVFGSKTYDKVSMQEIANAAGIAKSSIYTYLPIRKRCLWRPPIGTPSGLLRNSRPA